ncbi:MAG: peptidase S9, prolyl oligopeptidase, partial [Candidatus Fischerbacteria bacterium RBG_13_37_8]
KDIGGSENYQMYRYDMANGKITLITDGQSRNTGGKWSNHTNQLAYESTRRTGKDTDIWVINPTEPSSDHLLAELEGGGWSAIDWSPDDKKILLIEYVSINESYLWILDVEKGKKTLITPKSGKEKVYYGSAAFSGDGDGLYVTTDLNSEFVRLAFIDLRTVRYKYTFLTEKMNWDVEEFALSYDRSKIAFTTNERGVSILHVLDLKTSEEIPLPKLPIGILFGIIWHNNGNDIGFTMASPRSAYDAYSINLKTGTLDRWTNSELGGLNADTFSEPQLIQWKTFDGKEISGFLYRPPASFKGKRPVIIDIHGGPEGQAQPGFIGRDNYYLNELGVAMIFPNVRGSSGFGKTFLKLDNGFLRENTYKDIEALLEWIRPQPELDAERIMITGGSYGGHMALAIATRYSDKIRCTVSVVGISNLVTFLENTSPYRQDLRRVEYGDERDPKMREYLLKIAPINNAEKIKKPLFIIQGANDPRVPLSEAEQMLTTLKKIKTPAWYLVAKDEGHGFAKKQNQDFEFYATVLFVKEFLLK